MLKRGAFRGIAAALLASLPAPFAFAHGISLQPATVELELDPGRQVRQLITVSNTDPHKTMSVSLALADWSPGETGLPVLAGPGTDGPSAAGWVQFSPANVTLKPGESRQVRMTIAPPASVAASGDVHLALNASTVVPDGKAGWQKRETAALFYLTMGTAESLPRIVDSRLTLMPDGTPAIGLDIANDGNAHARLEGTIEIRGHDAEPFTLPVHDLIVPRDTELTWITPLDRPLPEIPVIEVRLDNVFAPQEMNETGALMPYRVKTEGGRAALP